MVSCPLFLIGGATTSRAHTAIKIAPHFSQPVVHVIDASLVVGVCNSLLSGNLREGFLAEHRIKEERERELFAGKGSTAVYIPYEEARAQKFQIDWSTADIATPESIGAHLEDPVPLTEIVEVFDCPPLLPRLGAARRLPQDPPASAARRGGSKALRRRPPRPR